VVRASLAGSGIVARHSRQGLDTGIRGFGLGYLMNGGCLFQQSLATFQVGGHRSSNTESQGGLAMKMTQHEISIHNRRPERPRLKSLADDLRRPRLLAARSYPLRSVSRTAILLGQWDGGSVLHKFGMPLRLPLDTKGNVSAVQKSEATQQLDEEAGHPGGAGGAGNTEAEGSSQPQGQVTTEEDV
jgi:hypothetical protein